MADAAHWDDRYRTLGSTSVSWFETEPTMSLELIDALGVGPDHSVIDVGGGASVLADRLLARGHVDIGLLDLSSAALAEARERIGDSKAITWIEADIVTWTPSRQWDLWHDRAVAHFLTTDDQRAAYTAALRSAVGPSGAFVIGAFAPDGPTHCSGLEVRRQGFDDLVDLAGDGAAIKQRRHQVHRTPGGADQSFNWIAGRFFSA
jgi:SAM-dependent methyltransferase